MEIETHSGHRDQVTYDALGREIERRSASGYWSKRSYVPRENGGVIVSYENSKKGWWRKHLDANDRQLMLEDQLGRWRVINDSSHLIYHDDSTGLYRVGKLIGVEGTIRARICAPGKRYCPSIIYSINHVEWGKRSQPGGWYVRFKASLQRLLKTLMR